MLHSSNAYTGIGPFYLTGPFWFFESTSPKINLA